MAKLTKNGSSAIFERDNVDNQFTGLGLKARFYGLNVTIESQGLVFYDDLLSGLLNASNVAYTESELKTFIGSFSIGGGGGGSITDVTATLPLISSGGANPNIGFDNTTINGNYGLNFVGGVATLIPIQGEIVGSYKAFATTLIPSNYLFCNGAIVNIATYPNLFAIIGTDYGGDGITTFGIPDLQGRFLKGDNGTDIGTSDGANTLNTNQLPIVNTIGSITVSQNDGDITATNGAYFANGIEGGAGGSVTSFVANGSQNPTVNIAGVNVNFGSGQPHEHPNITVRWAICFESVGVNGASPTPSLPQVLAVNGEYIVLTETSTISDFVAEQTHYYIGKAPITFNYDLLPYPLPNPVTGFSFVNQSVFDVTFLSDSGNSIYTLKPAQSLQDIQIIDNGGFWLVSPTQYFDNLYNLQQTTNKGSVTTNALIVRNNPDTYRVRYSILGQQVQRDDLGYEINYVDDAITKRTYAGVKSWDLQFPDLGTNGNNTSYLVIFRPNVSGTVAYLSDINNTTTVVRSLSDLPTPIAGIIQLANNVTYQFKGLVNIGTNQLQAGTSNTLLGFDKSDDGIVYTGTGAAILCNDKTLSIVNILGSSPNGTFFNVINTTSFSFQIRECIVASGGLGTITGGNIIAITGNIFASAMTGGITVQGICNKLVFSNNFHEGITTAGTLINVPSGSFKNIEILASNFTVTAGVVGVNIGTVTYTSTTNEAGVITGNTFDGIGTYITGINTESDNNWLVIGNTGVLSTATRGQMYMVSNGTNTTIPNITSYVKAAGTTTAAVLSRMTMPTTNRIQYTGVKPTTLKVVASGSVTSVSANQTVRVILAKNGIIISESETEVRVTTSNEGVQFALNSYVSVVTNDFVEVFVRNVSTTGAVRVEYLSLII